MNSAGSPSTSTLQTAIVPQHRRSALFVAVALLSIHAGLLAYSATRHSPTVFEPKFLVAGLSHWELGRFELFRVNPPLVRLVAALPVIAAGYESDWSQYSISPVSRSSGFAVAGDFVKNHGERTFWLITLARWACIPFSLIGGVVCFLWARELTGSHAAGLIALFLWCFDPTILGHGELINTDCAAASLGISAGYCFWRWLRQPDWSRACTAGIVLGLAELTKLSWVILFGLFPLLWLLWTWGPVGKRAALRVASRRTQASQLGLQLMLALYVINVAYNFYGTFTPLREFAFVSQALTGNKEPREPGNRFADMWLGHVPVPVPRPYVEGIDHQKADFEEFSHISYLRGEWKQGGWWYYYLYAFGVKTPHGTQMLLFIATLAVLARAWPRGRVSASIHSFQNAATFRDFVVLLAPAVALFVLVSSQLEFNIHYRYVLPAFGFLFVFIAAGVHPLLAAGPRARRVRADAE